MKIVLDALGLPRFGGARSSAVGWLTALAEHGSEHQFWVFVSRPEPELSGFPNLQQRIAPVTNRLLVRIWAQVTIPVFLRRVNADLFHATKNLGIIGAPCPMIVTINDLTHVILAEYYPWLDRMYWKWAQPWILRQSARVIAISKNTRQELLLYYGLDEHSTVVIYPSYHPRYQRAVDTATRAAVRKRYDLPESYILYVGGLGLHKNVSTLVASYNVIAGRILQGLVLVGGHYHTSSDQALLRQIVEHGNTRRIRLLDAVPEEDMPAIYQMADIFVLPSLNEGFGLTLIEAMVSGVPVIAGRTSAIPEVVGNAGYLLDDVRDQDALAQAMLTLANSPAQRALLAQLGQERARTFSWHSTAQLTLALYADVCYRESEK